MSTSALPAQGFRMLSLNGSKPRPQEEHSPYVLLTEVLREEFRSLSVTLREDIRKELGASNGANAYEMGPGLTQQQADRNGNTRPPVHNGTNGHLDATNGHLDASNGSGTSPMDSASRTASPLGPRGAGIIAIGANPPAVPPLPGTLGDETLAAEYQNVADFVARHCAPGIFGETPSGKAWEPDSDDIRAKRAASEYSCLQPDLSHCLGDQGRQLGRQSDLSCLQLGRQSDLSSHGIGKISTRRDSTETRDTHDPCEQIVSTKSTRSRIAHRFRDSLDPDRLTRPTVANTLEELGYVQGQSCSDVVQLAVKSHYFDYVVCSLLIGNSLFMGVQVDAQVRYRDGAEPPIFRAMDVFFCVMFTSELTLRLWVYGLKFYCMPGWGWSIFDTVLVGMQLFEELFSLITKLMMNQQQGGDDGGPGTSNVRVLRVLRIVRMLRVVRVLRLVRFVHDLRKVIYLIIASFWSFIWTAVLLGMLIYILAIFMTQVVVDTWFDDPDVASEGMPLNHYFGTTGDSILSLYMAITGGADWEVMSEPLMEHISPFMGLVFSLYVMFATLVLLNLVTGVFVDGAMTLSRDDKRAELLKGVTKAFLHTDVDGTGEITPTEWERVKDTREIQDLLHLIEVTPFHTKFLFEILDSDGDGHLTVQEFANGALGLNHPIKAIDFFVQHSQLKDTVKDIRSSILQIQTHLGLESQGDIGIASFPLDELGGVEPRWRSNSAINRGSQVSSLADKWVLGRERPSAVSFAPSLIDTQPQTRMTSLQASAVTSTLSSTKPGP